MRASTVSPSTAPLGDVQTRDDLDAADGGGGRAPRDRHDVAQQAVDPVADPQVAGLRLDVHVAGPGADGVGEHHVDEPDDGRRLDGLRGDVDLGRVVGVQPLEQGVDVGGVLRQRPRAGQVVAYLAVGRHQHDQLPDAGVELDVVQREHVGRVGGGDGDAGADPLEHQDPAALGDRPGQQPYVVGHDDGAAEVDQRQPEGLGERLRDLALGAEAGFDDHCAEPLAGALVGHPPLQGERLLQLGIGEQPLLHQDLADPAPARTGVRQAGGGIGGCGHVRCIGRRAVRVKRPGPPVC